MNADKAGYCSPNYKLLHELKSDIFESQGRIFLAIERPNLFNIIDCLNTAVVRGRKIVPYDANATEIINALKDEGFLHLQKDSIQSIEEVNRLRAQDVLVFMTGYGKKFFDRIALLATKNNDEKIVFLTKNDTFVFGSHILPETETVATETIDELFRADCTVLRPNPKTYLRMRACEEDTKYFIATFRPRYFIPVSAPFVKLLASAKIAINMNVGLNHNNVIIVDNGDVVEFEAGFGRVSSSKVIAGDVFIDGKGIGDIGALVLEERQRFADEGVIVLGVTISKSKREIVAGPDVQARGLVFLKDNEGLIREITRLFVSTVQNELVKENYSLVYMETAIKDIVFKAVRRAINKTPTIIPVISEIN
jgi:ribonuclease J